MFTPRATLLKKLEALNSRIESIQSMPMPDTTVGDDADRAADNDIRIRRNAELNELNKGVQSITKALARLRQGEYGICEVCSDDIDPRRLKIKPEATHCVECLINTKKTAA